VKFPLTVPYRAVILPCIMVHPQANQSQADRIISRFGGQSALAKAIGTSQGTIWGWKVRGFVPVRAQQRVMDAAARLGLDLSPDDFFEKAA
jgi:hypothetical protein